MGSTAGTGGTVGRDALVSALKRWQPVKLRAELDDGARDIAIPNRRRRWEAVCETLDGLAWRKLECLDKAGALLGVIEGDGPAPVADLDDDDVRKHAPKEQALLKLIIHAQDASAARMYETLGSLLAGYQNLVATISDRLGALERAYASNLELAHHAAQHAQGGEGDPADREMLRFLMARFGGPPAKLAAAAKEAATATGNGAAK
jgi:hypothetical protein